MKTSLKTNILLIIIYALLAFPMFYFVYKFGSPYLGMIDFFDYYNLYDTMDFRTADSPLNMRLIGSFFVYCMNKAGFFYDTATQIDNAPFNKHIFFNAIFFNFICIVTTCVMIYHLSKSKGHPTFMSFVAGLIYLLGFGTIFFEMMPLTDAFSVLMFTIVLWYYFKRSHWIIIPLILLILQREYVFMALGLVALIDYFQNRNRYYISILIYCVVCFMVYFILRKAVFETSRYAYQTNFHSLLYGFAKIDFPLMPFLRQLLMTLNIFIIYLALIFYKRRKQMSYNRHELRINLLLFLELMALTFLLALGNNSGRYFYMLTPLFILNIIEELQAFNWSAQSDVRN